MRPTDTQFRIRRIAVKSVLLFLAILSCMVLAACSASPTPDLQATIQAAVEATQAVRPTATFRPGPTNTPTPKSTDTPTDYSLSVGGVEDPATPDLGRYEPRVGTKLLAVEFVIGNISGETISVKARRGTLVDQEGFSYSPELHSRDDGEIDRIDLASGEKIRGWITFEVPDGTVAGYIKYEFSGYPDITLTASVDSGDLEAARPTPTKPPPPASNTPSHPAKAETESGAVKACQNRVREERPSHMVKFTGRLPTIHDEIGWVIEGQAEIGGRTYDYGCELVFVGGEWQIVDFMLD